jgi:hypothetical protein
VTLEPSAYEGRLDRDLEALVPPGLEIVRVPAWPYNMTRRVGLGDLGLRAFSGLRRACRRSSRANDSTPCLSRSIRSIRRFSAPGSRRNSACRSSWTIRIRGWRWGESVGGG